MDDLDQVASCHEAVMQVYDDDDDDDDDDDGDVDDDDDNLNINFA